MTYAPLRNAEAERAILGAVLTQQNVYYRIDLASDEFGVDAHRLIWDAIGYLHEERQDVDTITVKDELTRRGQLDQVGGHSFVSTLMDTVPDIANIERYAAIVRKNAELRKLLVIAKEIVDKANGEEADPSEISGDALSELNRHVTVESRQSIPLDRVLTEEYHRLHGLAEKDEAPGLTTGWGEMDFANVFRQTLVLLLSPSGGGKTAVAANLAHRLALHGSRVVVFTLESTEAEVALRWASRAARMPHSRTQDWRKLMMGDRGKLDYALAESKRLPILLNRKVRTIEGMYAECRRLKSQIGIDAAIVDYIQLVRTEEKIRDEEERYAAIAQKMLEYANDLRINFTATSQINKDWLKRPISRHSEENPKAQEIVGYDIHLEDAKRCAALSETARVVLSMYRPYLVGVARNRKGSDIKSCYVDMQIAKNNENISGSRYDAHLNEKTQTFEMGTCEENGCGQPPGAFVRQNPMPFGEA